MVTCSCCTNQAARHRLIYQFVHHVAQNLLIRLFHEHGGNGANHKTFAAKRSNLPPCRRKVLAVFGKQQRFPAVQVQRQGNGEALHRDSIGEALNSQAFIQNPLVRDVLINHGETGGRQRDNIRVSRLPQNLELAQLFREGTRARRRGKGVGGKGLCVGCWVLGNVSHSAGGMQSFASVGGASSSLPPSCSSLNSSCSLFPVPCSLFCSGGANAEIAASTMAANGAALFCDSGRSMSGRAKGETSGADVKAHWHGDFGRRKLRRGGFNLARRADGRHDSIGQQGIF